MAATDAQTFPAKNTAYRLYFPIVDADGDLVTAAAALDSEVSIDGGTFADATSEATEIATGSGVYYLDLTAAEMNGDCICVIVKTSTVGAKTAARVLYTDGAADVWGYASRTLTQSAAAVAAAMAGSTLTVTRTVSYAATLSGLTIPATWEAVYLTAKTNPLQADSDAQLQILASNPGAALTDGLLYLRGQTPALAGLVVGDASLTVDQAAGTVAIVVDDEATALLVAGTYSYDVKCLLTGGTSQLLAGLATFTVQDTVTETIA